MDNVNLAAPAQSKQSYPDHKDTETRTLKKGAEQVKSQAVINQPHDEALEFSQSGSDESVDTRASQKISKRKTETKSSAQILSTAPTKSNAQAPEALVRQEQVAKSQVRFNIPLSFLRFG